MPKPPRSPPVGAGVSAQPDGTGRFRTREEIVTYFDGLELIEPGFETLVHWWPDGPPEHLDPARRLMIGGIGRKPSLPPSPLDAPAPLPCWT
ncbi:SAM-dependent methyltransferase [Prauserella halophila]|uniref:SAM-dependent methyltransferase n=1 Tax=Prauserella halophila TaxID=185641 RepID=UPI003558BC2E